MAPGYSLKDELFNPSTVGDLAAMFVRADPAFDAARFQSEVLAAFSELELKQRIAHIAAVLADHLPRDFATAAKVIEAALPPPLDPTKTDNDFGRFIFAPLGEYVVNQGLERHFSSSVKLLEVLTQRFSMEYAVRPFLNRWPEEMLKVMERWVHHPHYHVRRLVSEGTRPKLPWGGKITLAPERALPFLDILHADTTRFVTRSAANHMNDIAKIDPEAVVERLRSWRKAGRQTRPGEMDWIARHALRTLVKDGHPGALAFLGFDAAGIGISGLRLASTVVPIGGTLEFTFDLHADVATKALVDYRIGFARARGKRAEKVFKLKVLDLPDGETVTLKKRHPLRGDATTYTLHPGPHQLIIQVNGEDLAEAAFELTAG
jgi:3-methyladenine DNA glycosylase AlkC